MKQHQGKTSRNLSQSSERRLASYVLAAGAAALGTIGLAAKSQAEVVYTPTYKSIPLSIYAEGPGYSLDLNGDGQPDFELINSTFGHGQHAWVRRGNQENRVLGTSVHAAALEAGASIGPAGPFAHRGGHAVGTSMGEQIESSGSIHTYGQWWNAHNRYLGFKFVIDGEIHYGWARISYNAISMLLTGYAYETKAGTPITAGQESGNHAANRIPSDSAEPVAMGATLGRLAQGATGIVAWRKEVM